MDDRASLARSRSSYLDAESLGDSSNVAEEFELEFSVNYEHLGVKDVLDILQHEYAVISGGKSKEGCPIITFPDNNHFEMISDIEYQRLMVYLTSVPPLHDADLGFHVIIDRRNDRWSSVKTVLLKISVYFPGLIHVVYILRPASFIQKALAEVSNKLFKEEFKFRMVIVSNTDELHKYINVQELTPDLDGTLSYCHENWIQERIEVETYSSITQQIAKELSEFTKTIEDSELPNDVETTQQLLDKLSLIYSNLKKDILLATKNGENLLLSFKEKHGFNNIYGDEYLQRLDTSGNIFAIERLLVQLEETEKTFDDFWLHNSNRLRHCLDLRRFEQDFKELHIKFEMNLKIISEMNELGDTIEKVDDLIRYTKSFESSCKFEIDKAEDVISSGQQLIRTNNSCPIECVQPKCLELDNVKNMLLECVKKRIDDLDSRRALLEQVEKANKWCTEGVELMARQTIEQCPNSVELTKRYLNEINEFIDPSNGAQRFKDFFLENISNGTNPLVVQVLQRIDDVSSLCNKRINSLNKLVAKSQKPVQPVEPTVPNRQQITESSAAPIASNKHVLRKANTIPKMSSSDMIEPSKEELILSPEDELNDMKAGHVLSELLETEKAYVNELLCVLNGYKLEAYKATLKKELVCSELDSKLGVIFGNLDEIHNFHSKIFLKDLENCISSIDLVALCFLQKRDTFFKLYSFYCQNISKSEDMREANSELNNFFQKCQCKLGHKLPLAAYLLKPVQRITKYQLLLKDLLRYSTEGKYCKELNQALDCMLIVLKCVNDSMHQISITGIPIELSDQGDLLLQGSFSIWMETKKDLRLRLKPVRRHLFLYQKAFLFCKPITKSTHTKATYQYKHFLKMSEIGLTESVKGDLKKFEIWLQGRLEVYTIQASNLEQKNAWVNEIKNILFNQLEEIKGEKIKQYAGFSHRPLRQTTSWETEKHTVSITPFIDHQRAFSCDADRTHEDGKEIQENDYNSSSDSDAEDHQQPHNQNMEQSGHYVALADYCAVGKSEVSMKEGDIVELLKEGCAGWWFVKMQRSSQEGWAPAAYLQSVHEKNTKNSNNKIQDTL